jgi:putative intracellular protease/amidase
MGGGERRVLIGITSHLGPLGRRPTGAWLGEISGFWHEVSREGVEVDFASPGGGDPPIDPLSALLPGESKEELVVRGARERMAKSLRSADVDPARYAAIYFAGGHGALWDLREDAGFAAVTTAIWRAGGVVAAVCHGPAALLSIEDERGRPLLEARRATGYSNLEEHVGGTASSLPFMLESEMRARGARYERARLPFARHVVVDGQLITGQNPASTRGVARAVLEQLGRARASSRPAPPPAGGERRATQPSPVGASPAGPSPAGPSSPTARR